MVIFCTHKSGIRCHADFTARNQSLSLIAIYCFGCKKRHLQNCLALEQLLGRSGAACKSVHANGQIWGRQFKKDINDCYAIFCLFKTWNIFQWKKHMCTSSSSAVTARRGPLQVLLGGLCNESTAWRGLQEGEPKRPNMTHGSTVVQRCGRTFQLFISFITTLF